jgi:hypothetical protein
MYAEEKSLGMKKKRAQLEYLLYRWKPMVVATQDQAIRKTRVQVHMMN